MKARSLMSMIGSVASAVVGVGILAAVSAHASNAQIKLTHSDTPYRGAAQTASTSKDRPAAPAEIQVAVMAKSPAQPAARRGVFIRR